MSPVRALLQHGSIIIPIRLLLFKTSTSLIQPEFKYLPKPKSTLYLKCNINTKTKIHFTIHNFQSIRIKTLLQNPNDPSAVFVNENALNIEQSRFVKQSWMQKIDYFYSAY
jgi:hypothetical protein